MSSEQTKEEIIATIEDRAQMYRLLAQIFFKPLMQEHIDAFRQMDLAGLAGDEASPYAAGYNDVYRYLRRANTGTRQELASDFTAVFYGATTHEGRSAQPIESLYRSHEGLIMGEATGEVYEAFRSFNFKVREGIDLPDDHLSFMFEFLAQLCDQTAAHIAAGDFAEASRIVEAHDEFFHAHILSWFPRFKAIANKLITTRFYAGWIKITAAFIADEENSLSELIRLIA